MPIVAYRIALRIWINNAKVLPFCQIRLFSQIPLMYWNCVDKRLFKVIPNRQMICDGRRLILIHGLV